MEDIIRYGITVENKQGLRVLYHLPTGPNRGHLWMTPEEPQAWLDACLARPDNQYNLRMTTHDMQHTLRVDPILCYHHGDPKGTVLGFADPDLDALANRITDGTATAAEEHAFATTIAERYGRK